MYKLIIRPILFWFDAEKVHHFTTSFLRFLCKLPLVPTILRKLYVITDKRLERNFFGISFKNPVGLAAGFDKNATLYKELSHLGFGFIEIGTVTPKPQEGNPKKRLFRLKTDNALINRMGFNNDGVLPIIDRLKKNKNIIIGGNIGKNKDTPNEKSVIDYAICFEVLFNYVDYFVVNVSSPNTPNLRTLQNRKPLTALLQRLQEKNNKKETPKPILLKIAPDLTNEQLLDIIEIVKETKLAGVIATNTTVERKNLKSPEKLTQEMGGLSGKPLKDRSTAIIRFLAEKSNKSFVIIGVGGIFSPEDALEKLEAGADLIQLYTGFAYEGPRLIKKINKAILKETD